MARSNTSLAAQIDGERAPGEERDVSVDEESTSGPASRAHGHPQPREAARGFVAMATGYAPFAVVAPVLRWALLLGAGGGFVLASVLSLSLAVHASLGSWWVALAQAHGHLQVDGWAGLFVLGVAFHFLPRLRGAPLPWPQWVPLLVVLQVGSLILRGIGQPLLALSGAGVASDLARVLLVLSAVAEVVALGGAAALVVMMALRGDGPPLRSRQALWSIWPFLVLAMVCLALASLVNAANLIALVVSPGTGGVVSSVGDNVNVTLGLFGFLVPMALAMSARALPMYAHLEAFPRRVLWPAAFAYAAGLVLVLFGTLVPDTTVLTRLSGLGLGLLGGVLIAFIALFTRLMSGRGRLPKKVSALAPAPERAARSYQRAITNERATFGPYVALIGTAYLWAFFAGVLLVIDGAAVLVSGQPLVTLDAARHSLAVGFIALLIAGVGTRMLPGFSGGHIASPRLVTALLILANAAALCRVGSLVFAPWLGAAQLALFGISGPLGLAYAVILAVNLWPALRSRPARGAQASAG